MGTNQNRGDCLTIDRRNCLMKTNRQEQRQSLAGIAGAATTDGGDVAKREDTAAAPGAKALENNLG
jgi:hypothetical protein